jgi:hypothetical protein
MNMAHKGWTISHMEYGSGYYAIGPDYDVDWLGDEDGYCDNGHKVEGNTIADTIVEIDCWIEERAA